MQNMNHTYFPGKDFKTCDLFAEICRSMFEENRIELEKTKICGESVYRWEFRNERHGVTLGQFLNCVDSGDEDNTVTIQVVFSGDDWDSFDTVRTTSPMLKSYNGYMISCVGVEDGIIRVGLVD